MLKLATGVLVETVASSSHRAASSTAGLRPRPVVGRARSRHIYSDCRNDDDDPKAANRSTTSAVAASERKSRGEGSANGSAAEPPAPPEKDQCCGSGCSNCVWLEYAEDLVEFYKDGGARAAEAVANIPDPNVRQFVKTELEHMLKHNK
nr:oxidoreductase-like domain-containing protein 1 [Dermacentor andersoni]